MQKLKVFDNVKSIGFEVTFKGNGCVNYDENKQKNVIKAFGLVNRKVNDNVKWAKKIFEPLPFNDEENKGPKARFKYKVSSDCIRHEMFKNEMAFQNPNISMITPILLNVIAQPAMLERGYMFASSTIPTIRKSSGFSITEAVEEGNWHTLVDLDFHSCSGSKGEEKSDTKKKKKDDDDEDEDTKGNTCLYLNENVGNHYYKAYGHIDLTELQFISGDMTYDRGAVFADGGVEESTYLTSLKNNFGEDYKFDTYYMKNSISCDEWGERGILLSKKAVDMMVKDIIKRMFNINIWRKDASFIFDSIVVTVNYGDDVVKSETIDTVHLLDAEDINQFDFNYFTKYNVCDEEKVKKNKELVKLFKNKK